MTMKDLGLTRVKTMTRVFHKLTRVGKSFLIDSGHILLLVLGQALQSKILEADV